MKKQYLNIIIPFNNFINLVYLLFLEVNPFSFFLSCSGFDAGPLSLVSSFCSSFGSFFTSSFFSFLVSSFDSSFGSSFGCYTGFSSSVFTSTFSSAFSGSAFLVSSRFGSSCDPLHIYIS